MGTGTRGRSEGARISGRGNRAAGSPVGRSDCGESFNARKMVDEKTAPECFGCLGRSGLPLEEIITRGLLLQLGSLRDSSIDSLCRQLFVQGAWVTSWVALDSTTDDQVGWFASSSYLKPRGSRCLPPLERSTVET